MNRIGVLTSGGDAPGMNAAIRAVVRCAAARDIEVVGFHNGYSGLLSGDCAVLGPRDVGGIIERAGTFLGTSRCEPLKTDAGQRTAIQQLADRKIEALVVIGGDGSQTGACRLSKMGARIIGIASTIDNDLVGADVSIGTTSALGVALEAIDRLRVTASSHRRAFLVEVMGRRCGYLALMAGITGGAEAILLPEVLLQPEALAEVIRDGYERGKSHAIIVVSEGAQYNADALAMYFREHAQRLGFELRVTKLGHVQRGGSPCAFDRMVATTLGAAAIEHLQAQCHGILLGYSRGEVISTPLSDVAGRTRNLDTGLLELARVLTA